MSYEAAVRELWCHHDLQDDRAPRLELVRYATLAASSHNTQPWRFQVEPHRILIRPDLSRRCPEVDPDDHHLFASLGCAAENLVLAARAAGYEPHVSCAPSPQGATPGTGGVWVELEVASPRRSVLFEAIPDRQCSRCVYDGSQLTSGEFRALEEAGGGDGVEILVLTGEDALDTVVDYVAEGNRAQFADAGWKEEMEAWVRFNAREALATRDGLYGPVMGSPDVPRWVGRLFMRFGFRPEAQNRKDREHIRSSAAVVVLHSATNDPRHWIEAGRSYERLALQATALGLRTAFINQPVEVQGLRAQFAAYLGLGDRRPDLVVRVGRGPETPRSLRRPVADVLA